MAKAVIIYIIIITAFVILLLLSNSPKTSHKVGHRRIRLTHSLSGPNGPQFDPLVAQMEVTTEEKRTLSLINSAKVENNNNNHNNNNYDHNDINYGRYNEIWENEIEVSEEDDDLSFGENGKLNLAWRLRLLFGMIDISPTDGEVDFKELHAWNLMQAKERLASASRIKLLAHDFNADSHISFQEFFPQFTTYHIEKNGKEYGEAGWWMEPFTIADVDHDSLLNLTEFRDFLHPEDSNNENLQTWFLSNKLRTMDWNGDGRLNFWEFHDNAYDTYRKYHQLSTGLDYVPPPEDVFADLDFNRDRWLTVEEILANKRFLFPGELDYASYNTTYLINEVDDDRNGMLNIDEMLNHKDKFYNIVYVEENDDDDYYDNLHDEF